MTRLERFSVERPFLAQAIGLLFSLPTMISLSVAFGPRFELKDAVFFGVMSCGFIVISIYQNGIGLTRMERVRIHQTCTSGRSTGEALLDAIAAERLRRAIRYGANPRYFFVVIALLYLCGPIVAAIRTGDAGWLLALLPGAVTALSFARVFCLEPPAVLLRRLTEQMSDGQPS